MAVEHGGKLLQVAREYGSDPEEWLDLSTGVSPFTYPVGDIPACVWNQLPQTDDGLEAAAKSYYNAPHEPLAVAGSQAAIMALPAVLREKLGRCGVVALPRVGYKEHEHAWRSFVHNQQQWTVLYYDDSPGQALLEQSDVLVVINPNNPSANLLSRAQLHKLHRQVAEQGGWLIVDEAFVDITPQCSVLSADKQLENLLVLRSVGKFFGLAGVRVGFLFAEAEIKAVMQEHLGPWCVTGPSRWVMRQALADTAWQQSSRVRIKRAGARLQQLLSRYLALPMAGSHLFTTLYLQDAARLHDLLCREQILCRLCDEKNALRFGLPGDQAQWQQLEQALIKLSDNGVL
jgi:cobalamin biosynthetic protein CobC